ncbi:E3 ubiquitin-protein ligase TRIM33 [Patella vulgata]|uniref:E3 ubiquitin-protein ligase TRIM33 n=1 Tax=Patella vulgata TaxID=6465 RepID=UPI00217F4FB6|nr:E3 ubiquitin-protein ligase TRIM33 [Patella vulgata]XP_050417817.1 E3 ubiquitin-protein ligase TRIM33 [Patella vulgata]
MAEQTVNINCSICLNDYTEPKTIECGHEFCVKCLEDYVSKVGKDNRFPCPLCRKDVTIPDGGIKNLSSTGKAEAVASKPCDVCISSPVAEFQCVNCDKCFCSSCKISHDLFLSDHHVLGINETVKIQKGRKTFCSRHKTEKLEFYCQDCCQIICKICMLSSHQDHNTPEICDYRSEAIEELQKLRQQLDEKKAEFQNYSDEVCKKINNMNESVRTSCAAIDQQVKSICDDVTKSGEQLKEEVQSTCKEEELKMKKIVDDTYKFIVQIEKVTEYITNILKDDPMHDVLDALPDTRKQRDDYQSHDLTMTYDVKSEFSQGQIITSRLQEMLGTLQILRGPTLKHSFNYGILSTTKDEWFYSPVFKIQDWSWYIRARNTSYKDGNYLDLGTVVYFGDRVTGSCTVKVTMELTNKSNSKKQTFTQTFKLPFGQLNWTKITPYSNLSVFAFMRDDSFTVKCTVLTTDIETF